MAASPYPLSETHHASAVALSGRAALLLGPSGAGKSSLALELMAYGATLVADDGVILERRAQALWAKAPETIAGRIEARGVGILHAEHASEALVVLAVDLGASEEQRLPPLREIEILDVGLPCVHKSEQVAFAAAILQYLKAGRAD